MVQNNAFLADEHSPERYSLEQQLAQQNSTEQEHKSGQNITKQKNIQQYSTLQKDTRKTTHNSMICSRCFTSAEYLSFNSV